MQNRPRRTRRRIEPSAEPERSLPALPLIWLSAYTRGVPAYTRGVPAHAAGVGSRRRGWLTPWECRHSPHRFPRHCFDVGLSYLPL
jgi:hypothetical protein